MFESYSSNYMPIPRENTPREPEPSLGQYVQSYGRLLGALWDAYPAYRAINSRSSRVPHELKMSDGYTVCVLAIACVLGLIGLLAGGLPGALGGAGGYLLGDLPRMIVWLKKHKS